MPHPLHYISAQVWNWVLLFLHRLLQTAVKSAMHLWLQLISTSLVHHFLLGKHNTQVACFVIPFSRTWWNLNMPQWDTEVGAQGGGEAEAEGEDAVAILKSPRTKWLPSQLTLYSPSLFLRCLFLVLHHKYINISIKNKETLFSCFYFKLSKRYTKNKLYELVCSSVIYHLSLW